MNPIPVIPAVPVPAVAKQGLPRPLVGIRTIERLLLRHATGPEPEKQLIVAVICQAMVDARCGQKLDRQSAIRFLRGPHLDAWAGMVDLLPSFVRAVARTTHYLPDDPKHGDDPVSPSPAKETGHAGLQ